MDVVKHTLVTKLLCLRESEEKNEVQTSPEQKGQKKLKKKKKNLGSCVRKGSGGRVEKVYGEGNAKETDGGQRGEKNKGVEKPLKK